MLEQSRRSAEMVDISSVFQKLHNWTLTRMCVCAWNVVIIGVFFSVLVIIIVSN